MDFHVHGTGISGSLNDDGEGSVAEPCRPAEGDHVEIIDLRPCGNQHGAMSDKKTESRKSQPPVGKSVAKIEKNLKAEDSESFSTPPSKRKTKPLNSSSKKRPSFHPRSNWQEPDREDGLTLYEWHRKPRPVLSGRIERPADSVLQCFRCAICLETIDKAVVVECLHRFCEGCIERALSAGTTSGQCPICRIPIPSRRKLTRDHGFDSLVQSIVGDLNAADGPDSKIPSLGAATLQKAILRKRTEQSKSPIRDVPLLSESGSAMTGFLHDGLSVIDFALFRYEDDCFDKQLERLSFPYIRTQDTVTVQVIKVFLKRKLNLGSHSKIQLLSLVESTRKHVILDDGLSLASIASTSSHDSEALTLFYRLEPNKRMKR